MDSAIRTTNPTPAFLFREGKFSLRRTQLPDPDSRSSFCFDGQRLSEYEQNTQQSPAFGRKTAPQLAQP
jgi:hypothetical protein